MYEWHDIAIEVGKLLLAAALGGAVGFEREFHGQTAGLRTNILVALAGCLLMMLSLHLAELFRHLTGNTSIRVDPGRIASYAVAGMGFLGAGAIIKGRGSVRGLTTAAGLWLVTGIGLAVGAGYILPAIVTTGVSLLVLYKLNLVKALVSHYTHSVLTVSCVADSGCLRRIKGILAAHRDIEVRFVNYRRTLAEGKVTYSFRLACRERIPWGRIVGELQAVPGLTDIAWEESEVP